MRNLQLIAIMQVMWQMCADGMSEKPLFNTKTINITAIKGQEAVLPCEVYNKGQKQIIWMSHKDRLISSGDRRVIDDTRMSIERPFVHDWNLHIRNVDVEDDGDYTCQINSNPIQIKKIRLKVQVPAEIDNATSSFDTTVREGTSVQLTCSANGVPKPEITWYRKTLHVQQNRERLEPVGDAGEVLVIHNITRYCGGLYECVAQNGILDPARRGINVVVEFSPEITLRNERMSQALGRETMLECFVSASPHGTSQWTKDGIPVAQSDPWKYKTEVYMEDSFTVALYLRIVNLEAPDFGIYTCEASNVLGKDSSSMTLYEYLPDPPTPPATTPGPAWQTNQRVPTHGYDPSRRIDEQNGGTPYRSGYAAAGDPYNGSVSIVTKQTTLLLTVQMVLLLHWTLSRQAQCFTLTS